MRSRYAAFAGGLVGYVVETTHPDGDPYEADRGAWERSIEQFCSSTEFVGLRILEGGTEEESGVLSGQVTFHATLMQGDRDVSFSERSRFFKVQGRWLYHSGDLSSSS